MQVENKAKEVLNSNKLYIENNYINLNVKKAKTNVNVEKIEVNKIYSKNKSTKKKTNKQKINKTIKLLETNQQFLKILLNKVLFLPYLKMSFFLSYRLL